MSIHEGHRQRMRRQLKTSGMDSLSDVQVLEVLLYYAIARADTNPIAHRLLDRFGSLSGVLEAAPDELLNIDGMGDAAAQLISLIPQLERRHFIDRSGKASILNSTSKCGQYLVPFFHGEQEEVVYLLCLDAKVNFDDNALYRHPELQALRDAAEEDEKEYRASQFDLNYVSLDGSIGCLVNGAGLAMATMDIIQKFGGSPANFLDVGGSATAERVEAAFEILLSDAHVRSIFVNIFGGIMKCDVIAEGIVTAAQKTGLPVPLIVRLEGTNVDRGREILRASGMNIIAAADMADGAHKAVQAANGGAAV